MTVDSSRVAGRIRENKIRMEQKEAKARFALAYGVREYKFSTGNLRKLLQVSVAPDQVELAKSLLGILGITHPNSWYRWLNTGGIFDHGDFWGSGRTPLIIVGHPYNISDKQKVFIERLNEINGIECTIGERESYYGFGTYHVQVKPEWFGERLRRKGRQ